MTIEELQAQVTQLQEEIAQRNEDLLKLTVEYNDHKAEAEKVITDLTDENQKLESEVAQLHETLEDKEVIIADLMKQLEASNSISASEIIQKIIALEEDEKNSLAFLCRTEKEGREAFIVMIYGKGFEKNLG